MQLFIWEDDGLLVILAETVEHAREIACAGRLQYDAWWDKHEAVVHRLVEQQRPGECIDLGVFPEYRASWAEEPVYWEGDEAVLAREPNRVLSLDQPRVVAANLCD